ncbi:MAG: biotin synthase BioB [Peptostreptococcaceae bacterium]|nr:biotin synthase BioB [Peptostreptococcaceae bacterium]
MNIIDLKNDILNGKLINKTEAMALVDVDIDLLCSLADEIRQKMCDNKFDLCSIVNGKSGKCSENCKFCAQSSFYDTGAETYPLLPQKDILSLAKYNKEKGVLRYSIVTSGKKLNEKEIDYMCDISENILNTLDVKVCASFGLLSEEEFRKVKKSGIVRIHNNLETSRRNFPNVCTTHTYDDKITAIKNAQKAGLEVCSGGIMGLGETYEDRIDMALDIRDLGVKSVPINMLNAIEGTPFEKNERLTDDDMRRIVAIYRFILPYAAIRLAGGRGLLSDKGKACFKSGANAAISGDMLTTTGITINDDIKMITELGYVAQIIEE